MARSSATGNWSTPMISPLPRLSKARAIARRSLVESLASPPNPRRVLSLPTSYRKGIRVIQVMCCPCLTRSTRLLSGARQDHSASLLARGAGHMRYKGLEGAVLQQGMTVMAHNGAVLVRIRQQQLSTQD